VTALSGVFKGSVAQSCNVPPFVTGAEPRQYHQSSRCQAQRKVRLNLSFHGLRALDRVAPSYGRQPPLNPHSFSPSLLDPVQWPLLSLAVLTRSIMHISPLTQVPDLSRNAGTHAKVSEYIGRATSGITHASFAIVVNMPPNAHRAFDLGTSPSAAVADLVPPGHPPAQKPGGSGVTICRAHVYLLCF
jgi:hypothetical protein